MSEGYERATIRRIADEVGVSSTALYMYFDDKNQILMEIGEKAATALSQAFEEIAEQDRDPAIKIHAMLEAMLRFGRENRYAYQLLFCVASENLAERRREASAALLDRCSDMLSASLLELRRQGRLRAGAPSTAARALWSVCHGLVAFPLACPDGMPGPVDDVERLTLEGLLRGLIVDFN